MNSWGIFGILWDGFIFVENPDVVSIEYSSNNQLFLLGHPVL